jgi:hypothetical protein|tara:strand:- start:1322 stop:1621 length:300 start_codon:yes stop_codon:yes gene_type:complete
MAKKRDGITDLTKLSVIAAEKLTPSQFKLFQSTIFAMLNGVQFGYTEMGPQFLHDTNDIYSIHNKTDKKTKTKKVIIKIKNNKSNVIDFNSYRREDVKI